MKVKGSKLSTLLMLFIITLQVCGPFVYNASETITNVLSEVETSEIETSEVELDEKSNTKMAKTFVMESESWPLLRDTDVVKVDSLLDELDNYTRLKSNVVVSNKFTNDKPGYFELIGVGDDIVGEWYKYVINDYVDVTFTITDTESYPGNTDVQEAVQIRADGADFGMRGYKSVKVKVDVTYFETGAPYVDDFLFYWQDIDSNQIFGVDANAKMAVTTNSDITYDDSDPEFTRFSANHDAVEFDDSINAVSKFENSSGFEWAFTSDKEAATSAIFGIPLALYVKEAPTVIEKLVIDENNDGLAQKGEKLNYQIKVINPSMTDVARLVSVRDSMLENLPTYLSFNNDVNVTSTGTTDFSGNLNDGTFAINKIEPGKTATITYSVTVNEIPTDVSSITNIATNDGTITCDVDTDDCDKVEIPVAGISTIKKTVKDENNDGAAEEGEKLTYTLTLNNAGSTDALNVPVRDSLVETTPSWLMYNDDVLIDPISSETSGDLKTGDLVIKNIPANSSMTIIYTMTVGKIPADAVNVTNIATNTEEIVDTCVADTDVCDEAIIPVLPNTLVEKSVVDANNDGKVEVGETLTYTLAVTNDNSALDATNITLRDTLLENIPIYLIFNNDVTVNPSTVTTGHLTDGDFAIDTIKAGETVNITYSMTLTEMPVDIAEVENIVTIDGTDTCNTESDDCDTTVTPVAPEIIIDVETPSEETLIPIEEIPSEEAVTPSEEAATPGEEATTPSEDNTEKKTEQMNKIAKTGQQSNIVFISMMLIVLSSLIIARVKRN